MNPTETRFPARGATLAIGAVSRPLACLLLVLSLLTAVASVAEDEVVATGAQTREWQFRVFLDDKEVGSHRYELRVSNGRRAVTSNAEFDVKFLFINAYRYRHSMTAEWQGNCLRSLQAQTDANGKELAVTGEITDGVFVVTRTGEAADEEVEELAACVMDFAYWNPSILEQQRLLNPQTGEYLNVDVRELGDTTLQVRGQARTVKAYRLTAKDMRIDVWYAADNHQWVALESLVEGGRVIRYELK